MTNTTTWCRSTTISTFHRRLTPPPLPATPTVELGPSTSGGYPANFEGLRPPALDVHVVEVMLRRRSVPQDGYLLEKLLLNFVRKFDSLNGEFL